MEAIKVTKKNETSVRIKTAIVGISLFLGLLIFAGYIGTIIISAVLTAIMCWEFSKFLYRLSDHIEKRNALLGISWLIVLFNVLMPRSGLEILMAAFIGLFTYYLVIAERHADQLRAHFEELIFTVFVLVYVVLFMQYLPLVRMSAHGMHWILLFLLINWAGDSAAYFVGRKYGKKKLYPLISPGKSVEGALGGLAGSFLAALIYKLIFFHSLSILGVFVTSILVGAFSIVGDLCESLIKRAYGIKDTGQILPGHGGMLDRFDGVLFTLPIMYMCTRIFA